MIRSIFSVIGIILAGAIFFVYTKPTYDSLQVTNAQITQYNAALDKAAELEKLKSDLLQRYKTLNPTDVERLQKMVPDHVDNIALIMDIDNIASHYGMSLQNVDISAPASQIATSPGQIAAPSASTEKFESLTMRFGTVGSYNNFLQFMTDLQTSLRLVDLVSVSITQPPQQVPGTPVYQYAITIRTYWLK